MKLSVAWANSVAQNVSLKVALLSTAGCCVVLSGVTLKLALKPPLIIERGCYSIAIQGSSAERTKSELESFVREAIRQRFVSEASVNGDLLSSEEAAARSQEQKDLSTKGMVQFVIVRSTEIKEGMVSVQGDRLISVGDIRSAFPFVMTATLRSTERSAGNPYGLQLSNIALVKKNNS